MIPNKCELKGRVEEIELLQPIFTTKWSESNK